MLFKKGEWVEAIDDEWDQYSKKPCCFKGERGYVVRDQQFENQQVVVCIKTRNRKYSMIDRFISPTNLKRINGPYDGLENFTPEQIREMEYNTR